MIRSFIFSDGKLVGQDLELEALRLVRSDKGLLLWVDMDNATPEEIKNILEGVFQFHPLAIKRVALGVNFLRRAHGQRLGGQGLCIGHRHRPHQVFHRRQPRR